MAIYFIRNATTGAIKVGYSAKPAERLKALQTGHADRLELIAEFPGKIADERALHARFGRHRINGEWFQPGPVLEYIEGRRREEARYRDEECLSGVYLAGKIRKHCWRHDLFDLRGHTSHDGEFEPAVFHDRNFYGGPLHNDVFRCVGPFFQSCDHGCAHGRSSHGLIGGCEDDRPFAPSSVARMCLKWLQRADVVFCWVDGDGAYGTMFELGFAHRMGLPIFMATTCLHGTGDDLRRDLWFARELADKSIAVSSVELAWVMFCRWWQADGIAIHRNRKGR